MLRPFIAVICAAIICSCLGPAPPATKAADAARELNIAARFGRMDIAANNTAAAAKAAFVERRRLWGGAIRVLDAEMANLTMIGPTEATVHVDFSWMRIDEQRLRITRVEQSWRNDEGSWLLVREHQIDGDIGLFGEGIPLKRQPHQDVHFPSRTLGKSPLK